MKRFYIKFVSLMFGLSLLMAGCSLGTSSQNSGSAAQEQTGMPVIHHNLSNPSTIDRIVIQVLDNMHYHAWNPVAMTKGKITGGLYINWKMSDPSIVNVTNPGPDGTTIHNHDPQVDLLYLNALAEYQRLHPEDHAYDSDIARMTATVQTDFQHYSLPKGWIYFYVLRVGLMLHNNTLVDEAYMIANNFYSVWYDPSIGTIYDHEHHPGDYDSNNTLQCGAALIDAGIRWHQPDWVTTGEKSIDHTIDHAFNKRYSLFYDSMYVDQTHDWIENPQSRPSTDGEAVEALVIAYALIHRQQYLDIATQILQGLFGSSGLWDTKNGGFFFSIKMNTGKVVTNYKETRSQDFILLALHYYNLLNLNPMQAQEQEMISVICNHFYQSDYHGFVYRLTPDFHIYTSKPGAGPGLEDYFTTEAMGASLDALQQTSLGAFIP